MFGRSTFGERAINTKRIEWAYLLYYTHVRKWLILWEQNSVMVSESWILMTVVRLNTHTHTHARARARARSLTHWNVDGKIISKITFRHTLWVLHCVDVGHVRNLEFSWMSSSRLALRCVEWRTTLCLRNFTPKKVLSAIVIHKSSLTFKRESVV
jgi:hypothetical protein